MFDIENRVGKEVVVRGALTPCALTDTSRLRKRPRAATVCSGVIRPNVLCAPVPVWDIEPNARPRTMAGPGTRRANGRAPAGTASNWAIPGPVMSSTDYNLAARPFAQERPLPPRRDQ